MGFFLRPKDTNQVDGKEGVHSAEAIVMRDNANDEYTSQTGVARHNRDGLRREAAPGAPLPSGGKSAGISSPGVRGWKGSVSKTTPSGFGRGTRAGKSGRRS